MAFLDKLRTELNIQVKRDAETGLWVYTIKNPTKTIHINRGGYSTVTNLMSDLKRDSQSYLRSLELVTPK